MTTGTAAIIEGADIAAARGVIPDTAAIIEGADVLAANATVAPPAKQVQSYTHLIRQAFFDVVKNDAFFAGYTIRKNRMLRIQHELLPYLGIYLIEEPMGPDGDANAGNIRFIHTPRIGFSIMLVNNDQDACEAALDAAYIYLYQLLWDDPALNNVFDTTNRHTGYQNPQNVRFESIERGVRRYVWGNTAVTNQTPVGELQYEITVKYRDYEEPGPFDDLLTLDVTTGVKPGDTQAEMDQRQQLHVQYRFDPSSFAAKREFKQRRKTYER
jgi:hypothetical protein